MTELNQADLDRLCFELGRREAQAISYERELAEREAELRDLRAQIAALVDRLPRPPDAAEGGE